MKTVAQAQRILISPREQRIGERENAVGVPENISTPKNKAPNRQGKIARP
ncbi:MAG: hypothetical protein QNL01_15715 [Akkermansiaceae bacterium]